MAGPPRQCLSVQMRTIVAIVAAILIAAIAGWTFIGLSFRSDWFGLWKQLQVGYASGQGLRRYIAYIVHRLVAALWTVCIVLQVASLFIWQRRYPLVHCIVGGLTVYFDLVNIASGMMTLIEQPFEDKWSTAFVGINAILNALLIAFFVLSRYNCSVPRSWHPCLGFGFLLSPLGFLLQTNIFFGECFSSRKPTVRITMWHVALIIAAVLAAALGTALYLTYMAWFSTYATAKTLDKAEPAVLSNNTT